MVATCAAPTFLHHVSKNVPTLASCSFDNHKLILIIFLVKQHQHIFKNDLCIQLSLSLHFYLLYLLLNSCNVILIMSGLLRDVMHSADYACARCPADCPSHARILLKRLNISYHQTFSPSGSHTILVYPHQTGASVILWGIKTCDFRQIYRSISVII